MKVQDFNFLSDHCMLTAKLMLVSRLCNDENICSDDTLECLAPDRFVWSERSKIKFQDVFTSPSTHEKIGNHNMIIGQGDYDVYSLIKAATDVKVCAGDMSLPRKTFKLKKKTLIEQKWFDKHCHCLLRELKAAKDALKRITE